MKKMKKILTVLLAAFVLTGAVAVPSAVQTEAAVSKITAQKAIRVGVGAQFGSNVYVDVPDATYSVKNIKAYKGKKKTSDLKFLYTGYTNQKDKMNDANSYYTRNIFVYANKAGTYNLKFDVYKGKKKAATKTVKVYALSNGGRAFAKILVNGKSVVSDPSRLSEYGYYQMFTNQKKAKVKFVPNKGIKIKKITVSTLDPKTGEYKSKTYKNGKKIALNNVALTITNTDAYNDYTYKSTSTGYWATTQFSVVFTDKYAAYPKAERFFDFTLIRKADKVIKQ